MKLSKLLPSEVSSKIQTSFKTHNFTVVSDDILRDLKLSIYSEWGKSSKKVYQCNSCDLLFFNWKDRIIQKVYIESGTGETNKFNYYYSSLFYKKIMNDDVESYLSISCGEYMMSNVLK